MPNSITNPETDIANAFDAWVETQIKLNSDLNNRPKLFEDLAILQGISADAGVGNTISQDGMQLLFQASEKLIKRCKRGRQISTNTALRKLEAAFGNELKRAIKKRVFSEDAVCKATSAEIKGLTYEKATLVLPVVFSSGVSQTDISLGRIRLLSHLKFDTEFAQTIRMAAADTVAASYEFKVIRDWQKYVAKYDHFMLVEIEGFEPEIRRSVARDAAEMFLNIIRMYIGLSHADDMRLGEGYIWETRRSFLTLGEDGSPHFGWASGPFGAILPDDWQSRFEQQMVPHRNMLASFVNWFLREPSSENPVLERVAYTHHLIAQTYSEPHDQIRLVRLISALEALSLLTGDKKRERLADRCAAAGAFGDTEIRQDIQNATLLAYSVRNEVVHGDDPSPNKVRVALIGLDKFLMRIVLGFMQLHAHVLSEDSPQSIKPFRRAVENRWPDFFDPKHFQDIAS